MNRESATFFARSVAEHYDDLANLLPIMKIKIDDEDYKYINRALAGVLAGILIDVLNPLYDNFPGLEAEIDLYIQDYLRGN